MLLEEPTVGDDATPCARLALHLDEHHGRLADEIERANVDAVSGSERYNLPEEVGPGVTYRDGRVQWRAAAKLKLDESDSGEQ